MLILRKLLLLAILGVSLAFGAPSATAQLHWLEHSASPVATGQHHHHAADGAIEIHKSQPDGEYEKDRDAKGVGHSHASNAAGEVIETAPVVTPAHAAREAPLADLGARTLPALEPPPRERPPRTA